MSGKIKVRCNGPEPHVNEIDLEQLLESIFAVRGDMPDISPDDSEFPLYEYCRRCSGHVIITKEIAEQARKTGDQ
jgi:hypothetical protein